MIIKYINLSLIYKKIMINFMHIDNCLNNFLTNLKFITQLLTENLSFL